MDVPGRLHVDRNRVSARVTKGVDLALRILDHQVNVKGQLGVAPAVFHGARPHRDRGDEVPVHHVEVHPIGTGLFEGGHFLSQPAEIRR